eukprot:2598220-Rhodomonas_salina.1
MGKSQSGNSKRGAGDGKTHPAARKSLAGQAAKKQAARVAAKAGRGRSRPRGGSERMKKVHMQPECSGEEDDHSESAGSNEVVESDWSQARELRVRRRSQRKKNENLWD